MKWTKTRFTCVYGHLTMYPMYGHLTMHPKCRSCRRAERTFKYWYNIWRSA